MDIAPSDAMIVERFIICGQVVLRLFPADGGGVVRGAKPYLEPALNSSPD